MFLMSSLLLLLLYCRPAPLYLQQGSYQSLQQLQSDDGQGGLGSVARGENSDVIPRAAVCLLCLLVQGWPF
jgi:hypothetical protein